MGNSTDLMDMIIHFRENEIILFKFWKTGSLSGMAVSMLITFLLCILYEAIKGFRLFIAIEHAKQRRTKTKRKQSTSNSADNVSEGSVSFAAFTPLLQLTGITKRLFTPFRITQAVFYGLQALLAYVLMLIVMTFNGNLILSVVVGESVGYFLFTGTPILEDPSQFAVDPSMPTALDDL